MACLWRRPSLSSGTTRRSRPRNGRGLRTAAAATQTKPSRIIVVVVEGQRRVGIVSEMLPGCRLGVCMRVGAAF